MPITVSQHMRHRVQQECLEWFDYYFSDLKTISIPDRASKYTIIHKSQRQSRTAVRHTLEAELSRQVSPPKSSTVTTDSMGCCLYYLIPYGRHEAQQEAVVQMEANILEMALQVLAGCSPVQASVATDRL